MSTRSGKRIHSSFHDNTKKAESDTLLKSERKTRNKRYKENEDTLDEKLTKSKKRQNYVSYPIEDEPVNVTATSDAAQVNTTRKIKRYTLKEHNINVPEGESFYSNVEAKKAKRVTRQTRKFADNIEDLPLSTENATYIVHIPLEENVPAVKKSKKNTKKKSRGSDIHTNTNEINNDEIRTVSKKSKKKKKKTKAKFSQEPEVKKALNATNASIDSFHSAASSPQVDNSGDEKATKTRLDTTYQNEKSLQNDIVKSSNKKSKSIDKTPEKCEVDNIVYDKKHSDLTSTQSDSIEKGAKTRKKFIKITEVDDTAISKVLNSTFDKSGTKQTSEILYTTFEKDPKVRRSLRSSHSHSVAENYDDNQAPKLSLDKPLNSTFEKVSKKGEISVIISLNSTFDKSNTILNTTFDKNEPTVDSGKSSLITSHEGTVNLTYDKEDNSRISLTSNESKTENIINTTPVLIESSMDESPLSTSKHSDHNTTKEKELSPTAATNNSTLQAPITPLKREGTFTKQSPEVKISDCTPTKRNSLPSPGFTPFHTTRSSQKSVLNVTRSIERSRRSSLAEVVPRQTKVVFCSPANNPVVVTQQKPKVIKSSMKGSNKSFVFDEKELVKPAARKRSYTHNDVDDRSTKRKRLADDLQQSVDRLSRPRTSSASAKLTDTPSKKAPTPSKPKSDIKRTKLPNFAALHQKEFAKMESLDECVDRRAKRARQLLTPNGAISVLERSSPKAAEVAVAKETNPKETKKPEKPETPVALPKLPTLESLRPGYTRFGFKMHSDVNPFSVPSKKDCKTTEKKPTKLEKPNGLNKSAISAPKTPSLPATAAAADKPLTKQPTLPLPSLNGATTTRKAAAIRTVLREQSFTSLTGKRDVKRHECRTIIKGVRTNRRFELQMKMRNID